MDAPDMPDPEQRVLVLAPTGRDAANSVAVLARAGLAATACRDIGELCREIDAGAAVVLLTEESLVLDRSGELVGAIGRQPAWSDLPLIVLTRGGPESPVATRAMATLGNIVLLERPVRVLTLVSATRAALRARGKQYQLRAQVAELQQADARKDEFLATLAHELRNPLAPIRTGLEVLKLSQAQPAAERTRAMMERQVVHMVRLLDDLLDVSRISRGKVELQRGPVELREVVESAVETCAPYVAAARHELSVSLPEAPVLLYADLTRLAQVFGNILINAAKYTPNGGKITLTARCERDEAVITVTDDGVGIPPAAQERVFEMFAQVATTADLAHRGLGIGLALVRYLVEMHGGTVSVASPGAGCGSSFTVRLPLLASAAAPAPPPAAPGAVATVPRRVLVVDDNTDAAHTFVTLLNLAGHTTRTAYNGPEALAVAREFHPEFVLLDIGLPGMNGYEVASHLRADPRLADAVLIALTGWGSERDKQRCITAGFAHHLTKPADVAAVLALLAGPTSPPAHS